MPHIFPSVVFFSALHFAVADSGGDAVCRDDASMLQLKAHEQNRDNHKSARQPRGGDTCTLDPLSTWKAVEQGTTQRENVVTFHNANITELVGCTFCVTDGQPWEGTPSLHGTDITIRAGRKRNADTRYCWFNPGTSLFAMSGLQTYSHYPDELNFGLKATMILTVFNRNFVCPGIRIAQGSNDKGNNWWLGCDPGGLLSPFSCEPSCTYLQCFCYENDVEVKLNFLTVSWNKNNEWRVEIEG